MTKLLLPLAALALLALTTACGGGDDKDDPKAEPTEVQKVTLTVNMTDPLPAGVLWNLDDVECTTQSFMDSLSEVTTQPVQLTVRDADGSIVATQTLAEFGGEWSKEGCSWQEVMELPSSPFYEVVVTSATGETKATVDNSAGGPIATDVAF